ncbi:MAG: hypothetical protein COB85_00550 [Bacteroidetes bacterium]|nr:MAG: hypothetical protein COB85_00550 [Bacteroidota bacterium]
MKKLAYIYLVVSLFLLSGVASVFSQHKWSKEQKMQLREADYYFKITNYLGALRIYRVLYEIDSIAPELNHKIGVCMFEAGREKLETIPYFEKAVGKEYVEAFIYLARCYHLQGRFDEAIELYNRYKDAEAKKVVEHTEVDRYIDISISADKRIKQPIEASIENLECRVNSEYSDYRPLISADESILIFTSRRKGSTGGQLDPYNHFFEDIYVSYRETDEWTEPQKIDSNINSDLHDAGVGLNSDGSMLIIFRTNKDLTGGDLYWSKLEGKSWTKPEKFGPSINTQWQETSASLTSDGRIIYFSSNRPGGFGGKDIYRVVKLPNGDWSLPVNLGGTINSPYDDDAPFIHADGKTLYYSSKGHTTMGGYDIFKSSRVEAPQHSGWTVPENMGYPINTLGDDIHFTLSADGYKGYYSSIKEDGCGGQDIYTVSIPFDRKSLALMKGVVLSADSLGKPIKATMVLVDEENLNLTGIYSSNSATGKYLIIIHPNRRYNLLVKAAGYTTYSESIHITDQESFEVIQKQIKLKPKPPKTVYTEQDGYILVDKEINLDPDTIVETAESAAELNFTMVKLEISSADSLSEPLNATLVFKDGQSKEPMDVHKSSTKGKYMVLINPNKKYNLMVNVAGYQTYEEDIDFSDEDSFTVISKLIRMKHEDNRVVKDE